MSAGDGGLVWLWPLMLVLGLALLAVGLVLLRRTGRPRLQDAGTEAPQRRSAAHAVLAERLARGEISEAEYRQRRSVLDER